MFDNISQVVDLRDDMIDALNMMELLEGKPQTFICSQLKKRDYKEAKAGLECQIESIRTFICSHKIVIQKVE